MTRESFEPFALQLLRRFLSGCDIDDLAGKGIPRDRLEQRLRAAMLVLLARRRKEGT